MADGQCAGLQPAPIAAARPARLQQWRRNKNKRIKNILAYKSVFVGYVVGEFEFVERDGLVHPVFAGGRGVWVNVHASRHLRVRLACNHPPRVVELVPTVVYGGDVDE